MSSATRSRLVRAALVAACLVCGSARAAVAESTGRTHAPAARDSNAFVRRFHFYASAGGGWIAAPATTRRHADAGQEFEAGIEARANRSLRLQLGLDYLVFPIRTTTTGVLLQGFDLDGNPIGTVVVTEQTHTGSALGLRAETRWQFLPATWLLAGGGVSHLNSHDPYALSVGTAYAGLYAEPFLVTSNVGIDLSGWGWSATLGVRRDMAFLGPVLGLEFRWTRLALGSDALGTASVRIGWGGWRDR